LAPLAMTLVGSASLAEAHDGLTLGGHIGFVLPLVTQSGGQTINDLADQLSIGFQGRNHYQGKRPAWRLTSNWTHL
jgi:hypothetical protein